MIARERDKVILMVGDLDGFRAAWADLLESGRERVSCEGWEWSGNGALMQDG